MNLAISTATILVAAIISSIVSVLIPRLSINYVSIVLGGGDCVDCTAQPSGGAVSFRNFYVHRCPVDLF